MNQSFDELYQIIPSPIPTAIELLRHLFVSPSTILLAPLAKAVIQRLQWLHPSFDDVNESYLYFNNMIDQGASGRIHQLRMEMIHAGPPFWQVCKLNQVEFKVDEKNLEFNGILCEIFARVTVWKNNKNYQEEKEEDKNKLAIILKFEIEDEEQEQGDEKKNLNEIKFNWKYFDLQDLITPGLDSRPWFGTLKEASKYNKNQNKIKEGNFSDEDKNYWEGYKSSSEEEEEEEDSISKNENKFKKNDSIEDEILKIRIQKTPLYRSKAPSVASSTNNSIDHYHQISHTGPHDLLSRISKTPLYKRAPSVDDDPSISPNQFLKSVDIINLPSSSQNLIDNSIITNSNSNDQSNQIKKNLNLLISKEESSTSNFIKKSSQSLPNLNNNNNDNNQHLSKSIQNLDEELFNSLISTFNFYKFSYNLIHNNKQNNNNNNLNSTSDFDIDNANKDVNNNDKDFSILDFNLGERFVALAHRVASNHSSCQKNK